MITGNKVSLNALEQASVAVQAMLISLMLQHTHADGARSIEPDAFHWFRRWRQPLPNEQIWIAL